VADRRVLIRDGVEEAISRIYGSFKLPILFWYTDSEIKSGYHNLEVQNSLRNVITKDNFGIKPL